MENTYYIYYLPNAIRKIDGTTIIGKIGYTSNPKHRIERAKSIDKHGKHDITGWYILEEFKGTRKEAGNREKYFQEKYGCVDGNRTIESNSARSVSVSKALSGRFTGKDNIMHRPDIKRKHQQSMKNPKTIKSISEGVSAAMKGKEQEKYVCPVCGRVGGVSTMKQHGHGEACTRPII
jgi:hypothetical protein